MLFLPGSILTLGGGFVFSSASNNFWTGVMLATTAVFFGASSGALAAFLIGRYLLREWTIELAQRYSLFQAIDSGKRVALLQLQCRSHQPLKR